MCNCSLLAQIQSLYSSQPISIGARSAALAGAFVSDAFDINSMYWNPAALVHLSLPSVIVNHSQEHIINSMNENISIPLQVRNAEAIGIGLTVNHVGYVGSSRDGEFKVVQYGYDLAYAREIIPTVSVGGAICVRYAKSANSNLWGVSSSMGIFYSPSEEISYGATLSGMGEGIRYISQENTSLSRENLPRRLRAGLTLQYPHESRWPIFRISISNEKIFGESGIRYQGGLELYPFTFLALRGGYLVEPGLEVPMYGFGFSFDWFRIDYAYSPSKLTDQSYYLSFAIALGYWQENVQQ